MCFRIYILSNFDFWNSLHRQQIVLPEGSQMKKIVLNIWNQNMFWEILNNFIFWPTMTNWAKLGAMNQVLLKIAENTLLDFQVILSSFVFFTIAEKFVPWSGRSSLTKFHLIEKNPQVQLKSKTPLCPLTAGGHFSMRKIFTVHQETFTAQWET